jgi:hypothetical protein
VKTPPSPSKALRSAEPAHRSSASFVDAVWTFFAATSALYFLSSNEADNDLWFHLFVGRRILAARAIPQVDDLSYTAAGSVWVDHEWLIQIAMAAVFDNAGSAALWIGKVALSVATVWLLWRSIVRISNTAWLRSAVIVLTVATLARGFPMRPQIVTYLLVAALLYWLDTLSDPSRSRLSPSTVAAVAALCLVWANAHGAFVVGIGILVLWAASPPWTANRWRWLLPLAGVAAACINPYGPYLYTYVLGELSFPHPLTEWQPVQLSDPAQRPFVVLFFATLSTVPFTRLLRRAPWRGALLVITAYMAFRHQRHVPLFALCAAAPLADQFNNASRWLRLGLSEAAQRTLALALLILAAVQLFTFGQRLIGQCGRIVFAAAEYPVGALRFAAREGLRGNLALPLDWGGYTLWHGSPAIKVSLDGRFATVYPRSVVGTNFDYFANITGAEGTRLLDAHPTTHVLAPTGQRLPRQEQLHPLYTDEVATLYSVDPRANGKSTHHGNSPEGWLPFP